MPLASFLLIVRSSESQQSLQAELTRLGHVIVGAATNGEEAFKLAGQVQPDFVVIDIALAGDNRAVAAARKAHAQHNAPVLYWLDEESDGTQTPGFADWDGFIVPPVRQRTLDAALALAVQKHQYELQLSQSEARYRAVMEQSADGILLLDPQSYRIIETNPALEKLLGYPQSQLKQKTIFDLTPDPQTEQSELLEAVQKRQQIKLQERRYQRKDGSTCYAEVTASLLQSNDQAFICLVMRDISNSKRSEQALQMSETRYKAIVDDQTELVCRFTPSDLAMTFVNRAYGRYYNREREKLITAPFLSGILASDHPKVIKTLAEITPQTKIASLVCQARLDLPEERWLEWTIRGIFNDNQVLIEYQAVGQDISQRKLAERGVQQRLAELALLNEAARAGAEASTRDQLIRRIVQAVQNHLHPDILAVYLYDPSKGLLQLNPASRPYDSQQQNDLPLADSLLAPTQEIADLAGRLSQQYHQRPLASQLNIMLRIGSRLIGVLCAGSSQAKFFSQTTEHLLTTLAGQMATGIDRLNTETAVMMQASHLAAIYQVSQQILTANLEPEEVYAAIHHAVESLMPCEAFTIGLVDETHHEIHLNYLYDKSGRCPSRRLPENTGFSGKVIATGFPVFIENFDADNDPFQSIHFGDEAHVRAIIAVPMRLGGKITGMLSAQSYRAYAYTQEDLQLFELLTTYAAIALENSRLYDETRRQALTFENLFDAAIITDTDGKVIDWNPAAERMFGFSRKEAINQPADLIYPEEDREQLQAMILTGIENQKRWQGEIRYLSKHSPGGIAELVIAPLQDEQNHLVATVSVHRDITARKIAEQALRESEEKYRRLFESMREGLVLLEVKLDAHGQVQDFIFIDINPVLERLINLKRADMIGSSLQRTLAWLPVEHLELFQQVAQTGQPARFELYVAELVRYFDIAVFRPRPGQCAAIFSDITERKHHEHEIEGVAKVSNALRSAQTVEEVSFIILEQAEEMVNASGSALILEDANSKEMVIGATYGHWSAHKDVRLSLADPEVSAIFQSGDILLRSAETKPGEAFFTQIFGPQRAMVGAPMIVDTRLMGMLCVGRNESFAQVEVHLLTALADIAANALHRASLYQQTRRYAEQVKRASAIGRTLAETLDLQAVYERLCQAAFELAPDLWVAAVYLNEQGGPMRGAFALGSNRSWRPHEFEQLHLPDPEAEVLNQILHTRQPSFGSTPNSRNPMAASWMDVPLISKGEILGLLRLQSPVPGRFSPADAELFSLVANMGAIAIENARLLASTQRSLQRLTALHAIDMAVASSLDLQLSLNIILDQTVALLALDAADILLMDPFTNTLHCVYGRGFQTQLFSRARLRPGESLAGRAALEGRMLHFSDLPSIAGTGLHRAFVAEGFVAYSAAPLIAKGQIKGVLEIFHRTHTQIDSEWQGFLETLAGQAAIAIENATLFNDLQRSNLELMLAYDTTLEGWSRALDLRDRETEGHTQRVTELTMHLAQAMGLSEEEQVRIRRGALLHDIGKMGIPDAILLKPGPLTPEEREIMRMHPIYAYEMLAPIQFLGSAMDIPYSHHEKWDGTGYPNGLKGDQIPLSARIFAVIDVWDSMTSDRPYRSAWPEEKVIAHIQGLIGTHFDPDIAETFLRLQPWKET